MKKMAPKVFLKSSLQDIIVQYVDYMQNALGRNFRVEKSILYAYDNFCYNRQIASMMSEESYLSYCMSGNITLRQRARRYRALYNFHEYCRIQDSKLAMIRRQPIESTYHRYKAYIYTDDEVRNIMKAGASFGANQTRYSKKRWPIIIGILYCTGLRINELLSLEMQDIDFDNMVFTIRETKFRKNRLVPVDSSVIKALRNYLSERPSQTSPLVIQNLKGGHLQYGNLNAFFNAVVKKLHLEKTGTNKPRLHDFRHSFAVNRVMLWEKQGENVQKMLPILATYMGHAHFSDTVYYLESSEQLLQETLTYFQAPEECCHEI